MPITARPYLQPVSFKPDAVLEFESYPLNIPAVREIEGIELHPDVTFFVGENGSGKSTVLEAIAVAMGFGPEGGTKNVQFSTADSTSQLHTLLRPSRSSRKPKDDYFLRAESFFNAASYMDDVGYLQSYGDRSLHAQSHGEAFMALRGSNSSWTMNQKVDLLSKGIRRRLAMGGRFRWGAAGKMKLNKLR